MPKAKFDPLLQFRAPLNYELGGKDFHIFLDNGTEISARFIDGENLQWAENCGPYLWEKYSCLKADDNTYFVLFSPAASEGQLNYCLIIDLLQDLVTLVILEGNQFEVSDRLIKVTPVFGAIKRQGLPLPTARHYFTDRMAGRRIVWQYSSGFNKMHIYYKPTLYRLPKVDTESFRRRYLAETDPEEKARLKGLVDRFDRTDPVYPFAEEPCFHITINEHMNLFCFVEENETLCDPLKAVGGGGIVLLQDLDRLVQNGVGFSKEGCNFCTAYGREVFEPDEVEALDVPYDETKLVTIPCIYDIKFGE